MAANDMNDADWDRRYATSDLVWSAEPNLWVEQLTSDLPPGNALDLAAGEGRNALWLVSRGWTATAVDFSQVGLDRAQALADQRLESAASRLTTICADVATYDPPPGSFDLVLVVYLQVPASIRSVAMRTAARAVAPGGTLLVIAHDSANLAEGFGGPQDPAVLYTAVDIAADIADSGLQIVRAEPANREVTTPAGPRTAIDAILMARRA